MSSDKFGQLRIESEHRPQEFKELRVKMTESLISRMRITTKQDVRSEEHDIIVM
jgi:hypothetical protein